MAIPVAGKFMECSMDNGCSACTAAVDSSLLRQPDAKLCMWLLCNLQPPGPRCRVRPSSATLPRRPPSWYPSGESIIWMRRSIWHNSALLVAYTSFTHQTCTKERSMFQKTATSEPIRHAGKRLSRTRQLCRARQTPQRTPTGSDTQPITRNGD